MKENLKLSFVIIISAIFLYAGLIKALDAQLFFEELKAFQLGSEKFLAVVALVLPFLEIYSAISLLISKLRRGALALIIFQLLIFEIWLGQAWYRDLIQECPCFGAKDIDIRVEFAINLLLIGSCVFFWMVEREGSQPTTP